MYGSQTEAAELKKGYRLPHPILTNPDLPRLINSDEVQAVIRPAGEAKTKRPFTQRKNPLKNFGVMVRLNPYAQTLRRAEILNERVKKSTDASKKARAAKVSAKRNTQYIQTLLSHDTA